MGTVYVMKSVNHYRLRSLWKQPLNISSRYILMAVKLVAREIASDFPIILSVPSLLYLKYAKHYRP